ncbi:MAG: quinone-dependent dihydroorotate dehydrogenase [Pseudomonadota bacterium]
MLYPYLRNALFLLDAERSHKLGLGGLKCIQNTPFLNLVSQQLPSVPRKVMGIDFPNPIGLAAGLDKNGECINAFSAMGFGFVEVGTVTPHPQPGNPLPRMFRLADHHAVINRMGFNNDGVDKLIKNIESAKFEGILGINIGKNFDTPVEEAARDYRIGMQRVYPFASYIVINISSPNTPNLRQLQFGEALHELLEMIKNEQEKLATQHGRRVPVAIKIAPDLSSGEIEQLAEAFSQANIDGVIATNTTNDRNAIKGHKHETQSGGLSGLPLLSKSNEIIRRLRHSLDGSIPIIGVGGVTCAHHVEEKIEAGADLVQIYTGLIYAGPTLIKESVLKLAEHQT